MARLAAVVGASLGSARAADGVWTGAAGDGLWQTPANWAVGVVPGRNDGTFTSPDVAVFNGSPTSTSVAIDPNRNVGGMSFDAPSTGFVIGTVGGNPLYLSGGGTTEATSNFVPPLTSPTTVIDFNAPLITAGATYTFLANHGIDGGFRFNGGLSAGAVPTIVTLGGTHATTSGSRAEMWGTISDGSAGGRISIVKEGPGTWELNAPETAPNSYSGDTIVNGGILRTSDGGGALSANSNYVVNNGGTLRFSVQLNGTTTTVFPTAKSVTVNSGGLLTASNANAQTNIRNENGPALHFNFGDSTSATTLAFGVGIRLTGTTPNQGGIKLTTGEFTPQVDLGATTSVLDLGAVTRTFDIGKGAGISYDLRIRGPISGGGPNGGILKTGPGVLRIDNAANTFTGKVEIREGELRLNVSNSLTGVPDLLISGGNLHVLGGATTNTQTFGQVTMTRGTMTASNDTSTVRAARYTFDVAAGDAVTVAPILADRPDADPAQLFKDGPGQATLSGNSTYRGGTVVREGILTVNRFAHSPLAVTGGIARVKSNAVANDPAGTSVVPALFIQGTTAQPRLDLTNNSLVVDYSPAGPSPLAEVREDLQSGYAGGAWNGTGIDSSLAPATGGTLGYAEASDVLGITGDQIATFSGVTVDATSVLVMYTRPGDADLDGEVNFDDFLRLRENFGQVPALWARGDFNYDGMVNFLDFQLLEVNFGGNVEGLVSNPTPDQAAVLAAFGAANVPEPGSAALLALATALLSRRRKS